jgi:hypothetical protein
MILTTPHYILILDSKVIAYKILMIKIKIIIIQHKFLIKFN